MVYFAEHRLLLEEVLSDPLLHEEALRRISGDSYRIGIADEEDFVDDDLEAPAPSLPLASLNE